MYGSSQAEKAGRSAFRAAVERSLTSSRVVVVDYLNHIKGYRYELWCRARETGTTYAVVYVDTPAEQCREWNLQRPESERYSEATSDTAGTGHTPSTEHAGRPQLIAGEVWGCAVRALRVG